MLDVGCREICLFSDPLEHQVWFHVSGCLSFLLLNHILDREPPEPYASRVLLYISLWHEQMLLYRKNQLLLCDLFCKCLVSALHLGHRALAKCLKIMWLLFDYSYLNLPPFPYFTCRPWTRRSTEVATAPMSIPRTSSLPALRRNTRRSMKNSTTWWRAIKL